MKTQKGHKKVLLGLSGGVDSSVAALILKRQGYEVIGAFMKNYSDTKNEFTGECAWREDRRMALRIALKLHIRFITLDFEEKYKKNVLEPMFKDYAKGKTPNPDILCNAVIKFPLLWKSAKELGLDYIATGHYARLKEDKEGFHLLAGKDETKDQSYFLTDLTQEDLKHTLFPLGSYTKKQIRKIAKKQGFPNWERIGSRGICFVGKTDMREFLKKKIKEKKGKVISPEGKLLGTHPGVMYYTIGQKAGDGNGIILNKPKQFAQKRFYIAEKRQGNVLVAAPEGHPALLTKSVILKRLHLINPRTSWEGSKIRGRFRHLGVFCEGALKREGKKWQFIFDTPQKGIAEGQTLAIYKKEILMGGGEIEKTN